MQQFSFLRGHSTEELDQKPIRIRVPGWYRGDDRDPARGGSHFAKIVTRVRPSAERASDFEGRYVDRGAVVQAPSGSVLLVVDTLSTSARRAHGVAVEGYAVDEDRLDDQGHLQRQLRLTTGPDWGRLARDKVKALLSNADQLEQGRLTALYGEAGGRVGAYLDWLLDLSDAEWEDLASLVENWDEETAKAAADRAFSAAFEAGRTRECQAARRVWHRVEFPARRASGLLVNLAELDAHELEERSRLLSRLRGAVQSAAVALVLGDLLDDDTYDALVEPLAGISQARETPFLVGAGRLRAGVRPAA